MSDVERKLELEWSRLNEEERQIEALLTVLTGELLKLKEDEKAIRLGIMRDSDRAEQRELNASAHNHSQETAQSEQIPLPEVPFHQDSGSLNLRGLAASSETSVTEVITKSERQ
ncbi:unnamed protein product [Oikopleura dioica]|uniref:Uncharacterized protein n=1 Tax=Oikopleura dioica TaxID=34765 RepID=E4XPY3_OIKDI|nr:unnamed protein product [Oikopleura dioica]